MIFFKFFCFFVFFPGRPKTSKGTFPLISHLVRREPRERRGAVVHQAEHQTQIGAVGAGDRPLRVERHLAPDVVVEDRAAGRPVLLGAAVCCCGGCGARRRGRRGGAGALAADVLLGAGEGGLAGGELSLARVEGRPGRGEGALSFFNGFFMFDHFKTLRIEAVRHCFSSLWLARGSSSSK